MTRGVFDKSTRVRSRKLPREARTGVCVLRVPLASSQAVQCKLRRNPPGWPILDEFFARGKCDLPNLHNNDVPGKGFTQTQQDDVIVSSPDTPISGTVSPVEYKERPINQKDRIVNVITVEDDVRAPGDDTPVTHTGSI